MKEMGTATDAARVQRNDVRLAGRNISDTYWRDPLHDQPVEYRKTATVLAQKVDYDGFIVTPEGEMRFHAGDYIVTDNPPTHAWPVAADVFERTHEAIG